MTTEAGRAYMEHVRWGHTGPVDRAEQAIAAIEAEAVAAERARIAEAVRGLAFWCPGDEAPRPIAAPNGPFDEVLSRAAVLALLDPD